MTTIRRHVTVPADLERVADLRAAVREVGAGCEAPADCIGDLVQAVDEAATNVIRYGYKGEPGSIEMTAELDRRRRSSSRSRTRRRRSIRRRSQGPDLSVPPHKRTPGGMGIHLMRLATDSMEHRARPGGGNILTLTRSRVRRPKEG